MKHRSEPGRAMNILVNGTSRSVEPDATIATLLAELGLDARTLAVERNMKLAPRGDHAATRLEEGDRIEIVTLVGGG